MKKFESLPLTFSLLIFLVGVLGCGQKMLEIGVPVKVDSEIDIDRYQKLAVLPFVQGELYAKSSNGLLDNNASLENMGPEIALMLRHRLSRHRAFEVVDSQETAEMIAGENLPGNVFEVEGQKQIAQIGEYLESSAVITGSFRFFTTSEPRRHYRERYSPGLQRYVSDYQDYLQKNYILVLRVVLVDVDSQKIIWDDIYRATASEAHSLGTLIVSQIASSDSTFRRLAKQSISQFIKKIAPHYEREDRYIALSPN